MTTEALPTESTAGEAARSAPGALILGGAHGSLAVARSLGRRGIPVWFVARDHPLPAFSRYVERSFSWAEAGPEELVKRLLDLGRRYDLAGWVLFAGSDAEVRLVAEHRAELATVFAVTTPAWPVTRFASDKHLTYEHAEALGIDYPHTYRPRDRAEVAALPCRFPVVLKPTLRRSANSFTMAKGWKACDPAELLARYDEAAALVGHDAIVIQEFIPGDGRAQFSYAAIYDRGVPVAALTARRTRQFPVEFGFSSTFVETVDNPAVAAIAERFLGMLGYGGIVELEFKFDARDGRYKLLDFNARAWTWIALGAAAGIDFPHILFEVARGHTVAPVAAQPARWMHFTRDLVAAWQQMRAGSLTFAEYFRGIRRPMTSAAFSFDDPLPGVLELPLSLYRALTRRGRFLMPAPPPILPRNPPTGPALLAARKPRD